jgi:hypothetical protein
MSKKCGCPSEEELDRIIKESMKLYGFYIHYIPLVGKIDSHTHGLIESFNHLDFQITLKLSPDTVSAMFHTIVDMVRQGKRFSNNEIVPNVLKGDYKIKLFQTTESRRPVLRILLPDIQGHFPDSVECDALYKEQLTIEPL